MDDLERSKRADAQLENFDYLSAKEKENELLSHIATDFHAHLATKIVKFHPSPQTRFV